MNFFNILRGRLGLFDLYMRLFFCWAHTFLMGHSEKLGSTQKYNPKPNILLGTFFKSRRGRPLDNRPSTD